MKLLATLITAALVFFAPALAIAATPQAVAAVAYVERATALQTFVGIAQEEYKAKLLDEATAALVVNLIKEAQAATEAQDYKSADEALASLADVLNEHSQPQSKV